MTRTDDILAALSSELERRRTDIDADKGLRSVSIILELNERTGLPRSVVFRTESRSAVTIDRVSTT